MKPRLLLLEFHHMGDAILSFPFIRGAEKIFDVWVFCRPCLRDVYEMVLPRERILAWEVFGAEGKSWEWRQGRLFLRQLEELGIHVAVCGWADPRVQALMVLCGARVRVGFPMTAGNYFTWKAAGVRNRLWQGKCAEKLLRMFLRKPLLTHPLQRHSWEQAHWKDWDQVGRACGMELSWETPWVDLPPVSCQYDWLLHLGARLPEKRWPVSGFTGVVEEYLNPAGLDWVCVAAEAESEGLPSRLKKNQIRTPKWTNLVKAVARSKAVLTHDTAVAHLAAAMGKQVVALFGAQPTTWFAPYGNEQHVVTSPGAGRDLLAGLTQEQVIEKMKAVTVRRE
jgi:ADP-heptose:LPS heptosyltransferase